MTVSTNEALLRRFYGLVEQAGTVDRAMPEVELLLHPDAEYVNPPDALEPGTRTGVGGFRAAFESALDGLGKNAMFSVGEVAERGPRVFAPVSITTGGTASGVELAGPTIGTVLTVEDGLIRRLEWFWRAEDARAHFESADE
jgi:hypothetical protein